MLISVKDGHGLIHIFDTAKYRFRLTQNSLDFIGELGKSFPLTSKESKEIEGILDHAIINQKNARIKIS